MKIRKGCPLGLSRRSHTWAGPVLGGFFAICIQLISAHGIGAAAQLPVDDAFQKITRAPKEDVGGQNGDGIVVDDHGNIVDAPSYTKPEIQTLPAPGLKSLESVPPASEPAAAPSSPPSTGQSKPETTQATKPNLTAEASSIPVATPTQTPAPALAPAPESASTPPSKAQNPNTSSTPAVSPAPSPAPVQKHGTHGPASASAPIPALAPEASTSVPADKSLRWLTNGNARFVKHALRADGRSANDRTRLVSGEHPHAIVLSCSDSRQPSELIFDQALGEILSVRVNGEVLDTSVIATIEDGIERLGIKLVIVMGHTRCDAVANAVKPASEVKDLSESAKKVRESLQAHLKSANHEKPSANLDVEAALNADSIARELSNASDVIRRHVEAGDVVIKSALYHLDSGAVKFY